MNISNIKTNKNKIKIKMQTKTDKRVEMPTDEAGKKEFFEAWDKAEAGIAISFEDDEENKEYNVRVLGHGSSCDMTTAFVTLMYKDENLREILIDAYHEFLKDKLITSK